MFNCLCNNNWYMYLLIILLLNCGGCDCIKGIIDKICDCGYIVPLIMLILCCCKDKGFAPCGTGCGCK